MKILKELQSLVNKELATNKVEFNDFDVLIRCNDKSLENFRKRIGFEVSLIKNT